MRSSIIDTRLFQTFHLGNFRPSKGSYLVTSIYFMASPRFEKYILTMAYMPATFLPILRRNSKEHLSMTTAPFPIIPSL